MAHVSVSNSFVFLSAWNFNLISILHGSRRKKQHWTNVRVSVCRRQCAISSKYELHFLSIHNCETFCFDWNIRMRKGILRDGGGETFRLLSLTMKVTFFIMDQLSCTFFPSAILARFANTNNGVHLCMPINLIPNRQKL